ncbi:MAG: exonuclease domain-containing protein, partial [Myxococcota bacterium]
MMGFWRRLGWRWRASRVRSEGPLRGVVEAGMPDMAQPLSKARLLALDLEMTGLDAKRDAIVSIGFVPVDGRTIVMSGARRFLVQVEGSVGHSATIHGIRDVDLQRGAMPLTQA